MLIWDVSSLDVLYINAVPAGWPTLFPAHASTYFHLHKKARQKSIICEFGPGAQAAHASEELHNNHSGTC